MQLILLRTIFGPMPLDQLTNDQVKELQVALSHLGYPVGLIDGLIGPRTRTAWAEFKTDIVEGNPDMVGQLAVSALETKVDRSESNHDFSTKRGTMAAIIDECRRQDIRLKTQIAYILATVEWETAKTFAPVKEAFWKDEDWRRKHLPYFPYYGRGYVQLTWETNYEKYARLLDIDLVGNPDLALNPDTALFVLVHGFKTGSFTGRRITDFINEFKTDYIGARRCINGTDHNNDIAHLAQKYAAMAPDEVLESVLTA